MEELEQNIESQSRRVLVVDDEPLPILGKKSVTLDCWGFPVTVTSSIMTWSLGVTSSIMAVAAAGSATVDILNLSLIHI